MKGLIIAAIAALSLNAAAEGNIGFGGEVELITTVDLTSSPAVGLSMDDSQQFLGSFVENNNDPRGYQVNVSSAGEFALINSINSTVKVAYALDYVDGNGAGAVGQTSDFSVIYSPPQGQAAEVTEDKETTLSITLDSDDLEGGLHGGAYVDELTVTATHL